MQHMARQKGWKLPENYSGYAFLSYDSEPLPTNYVTAAEVLKFRDKAWQQYFSNSAYLKLVETQFGEKERANVEAMAKGRFSRTLLGD